MDVSKAIYLLWGLATVILLATIVNCFQREREYLDYCEYENFAESTPPCICDEITNTIEWIQDSKGIFIINYSR